MSNLRTAETQTARYDIELSKLHVAYIIYGWAQRIDDILKRQIIELMQETTASTPIIGFGATISDPEAAAYIRELDENLAAGKWRLLTIRANGSQLVGLCTLKRNLNPNNRHITDLSKGMIGSKYRGHLILPAAFYEIALQCEADGVEVVTLDVRAGTAAHQIWQRFGFETYGTLPDYARADGQRFAGHFMMQQTADLKARAYGALTAGIIQRISIL